MGRWSSSDSKMNAPDVLISSGSAKTTGVARRSCDPASTSMTIGLAASAPNSPATVRARSNAAIRDPMIGNLHFAAPISPTIRHRLIGRDDDPGASSHILVLLTPTSIVHRLPQKIGSSARHSLNRSAARLHVQELCLMLIALRPHPIT